MPALKFARRSFLKGVGGLAALSHVGLSARSFAGPGAPPPLNGVNLAGAEFGATMPGVRGVDYVYPDLSEFNAFAALGFASIRLPFRWERLQPRVDGPFDEEEWSEIERVLTWADANNVRLILDVHNYAKRHVASDDFAEARSIGSPAAPTMAFARFWTELAERAQPHPSAIFGLMNEPIDIDALDWLDVVNTTVDAIRLGGGQQLILVPGVNWTGAHSWFPSGNAVMEGVRDPADNFAIEVHQYVDGNSAGQLPEAVSSTIGLQRLEAFQTWARSRKLKAYLGEFGSGRSALSLAALEEMLIEMASAPDVWVGWAGWAAGPWWADDYALRLSRDPDGEFPPQTRLMAAYAAPSETRRIVSSDSAVEVDFARNRLRGATSYNDVLRFSRASSGSAMTRDGGVQRFDAETPRITDLGLRLEGASETMLDADDLFGAVVGVGGGLSDVPAPDPETDAVALGLGGVDVRLWPVRPLNGVGLTTFAVHAWSDPRQFLELEMLVVDQRVVFELGAGQAHALSGDISASLSTTGDWRRLEISWRASSAPEIYLRVVRSREVDVRSEGAARVALWRPTLELGGGATLFDGPERNADIAELIGAFASIAATGEGTIYIETRDVAAAPSFRPILSLGDKVLLGRGEDGALVTDLGGGRRTGARPMSEWMHRQRHAVSFSSSLDVAIIATTGEAPLEIGGSGFSSLEGALRLGGLRDLGLNGSVTRIAAFDQAMFADDMAALVA